jgi:hypothetical protein
VLPTIVKGFGGIAAILALVVLLFVLPVTVVMKMEPWIGPLARGVYASAATAAVLTAIPFGFVFSLIPTRAVVWKALAVSIAAALLMFLLVAVTGSVHTTYAASVAVECGIFVALFWLVAAAGHRLTLRLRLRHSAALGTCVFATLFILLVALSFYATFSNAPMTHEARLQRALQEVRSANTDIQKFYALGDAAKESFVLSHIDDARQFATDLLRIAEKCRGDWNYGNAIHDGNLVLGRIALREGRVDDAKRFLLVAGNTPGSPQLDSFGPNMSLAKDLLEHGETSVVLEYFELCRKFWEMESGKLNDWAKDIQAGKVPDFGANLLY